MSWLRLLGDERIGGGRQADLWRRQHPDLAERVSILIHDLEAAGVQPDRWPYPPETVRAGEFQRGLMLLKASDGYDAVVGVLEEHWARDQRNLARAVAEEEQPISSRRIPLERSQIVEARERLRLAGQPYGYATLASKFNVSVTTIRRRLGKL